MYWETALSILIVPTVATVYLFLYYRYYKKEKKQPQLYFNLYFALLVIEILFYSIQTHAEESIKRVYIGKNCNDCKADNNIAENTN